MGNARRRMPEGHQKRIIPKKARRMFAAKREHSRAPERIGPPACRRRANSSGSLPYLPRQIGRRRRRIAVGGGDAADPQQPKQPISALLARRIDFAVNRRKRRAFCENRSASFEKRRKAKEYNVLRAMIYNSGSAYNVRKACKMRKVCKVRK